MMRDFQRAGLRVSLVLLHCIALVLMLVLPWIFPRLRAAPAQRKADVRPNSPSPSPRRPRRKRRTPEPPKPEPTDDSRWPTRKSRRSRNAQGHPPDQRAWFARTCPPAPKPKDKPLSEGRNRPPASRWARAIGDTTSRPDASQLSLGAYYNHVHERMYARLAATGAAQVPAGAQHRSAHSSVAHDGRISDRAKIRGSGKS
jgi:hypothetical protein